MNEPDVCDVCGGEWGPWREWYPTDTGHNRGRYCTKCARICVDVEATITIKQEWLAAEPAR